MEKRDFKRLKESRIKRKVDWYLAKRKLQEKTEKYPKLDLASLSSALEKIDKTIEDALDKNRVVLKRRAQMGDQHSELFMDAVDQTRGLLLDLLAMADDLE